MVISFAMEAPSQLDGKLFCREDSQLTDCLSSEIVQLVGIMAARFPSPDPSLPGNTQQPYFSPLLLQRIPPQRRHFCPN